MSRHVFKLLLALIIQYCSSQRFEPTETPTVGIVLRTRGPTTVVNDDFIEESAAPSSVVLKTRGPTPTTADDATNAPTDSSPTTFRRLPTHMPTFPPITTHFPTDSETYASIQPTIDPTDGFSLNPTLSSTCEPTATLVAFSSEPTLTLFISTSEPTVDVEDTSSFPTARPTLTSHPTAEPTAGPVVLDVWSGGQFVLLVLMLIIVVGFLVILMCCKTPESREALESKGVVNKLDIDSISETTPLTSASASASAVTPAERLSV